MPLKPVSVAVKFQFHKGTIRTDRILVPNRIDKDFNSIKVRLEPFTRYIAKDSVIFQFHKGTIRTCSVSRQLNSINNFNSIKVRLEQGFYKYFVCSELFQFHKGTIRTGLSPKKL